MTIFELVIDEESDAYGIQAISLVESPAIEEDFVALSDEFRFKAIDNERRIVMGPALIPDKPIYRRKGEEEFFIFFSKETIRRAMELYFKAGFQANATLEHQAPITGTTIVESWIVEGEQDKSRMYGLNVPKGTWMVSMKIDDETLWSDWVKGGKVKGFSIEGLFTRKEGETQLSAAFSWDAFEDSLTDLVNILNEKCYTNKTL